MHVCGNVDDHDGSQDNFLYFIFIIFAYVLFDIIQECCLRVSHSLKTTFFIRTRYKNVPKRSTSDKNMCKTSHNTVEWI